MATVKLTFGLDLGEPRIPYHDPIACANVVRQEFVDLRTDPDLIDLLPELERSETLRNAIRLLNSKQSMFRTYGCDYEMKRGSTQQDGTQRSATDSRIDAYIHLGFEHYCYDRDPYAILSGRLATHLLIHFPPSTDDSPDIDEIALSIDPLTICEVDKGFVLQASFSVHDFADDRLQKRWAALIGAFADYLASYSR